MASDEKYSPSVREDGSLMTKDEVITELMELFIATLRKLEGKIVLSQQELQDAHDFTFIADHKADSMTVEVSLINIEEAIAESRRLMERRHAREQG